jgi:hypothetical protein
MTSRAERGTSGTRHEVRTSRSIPDAARRTAATAKRRRQGPGAASKMAGRRTAAAKPGEIDFDPLPPEKSAWRDCPFRSWSRPGRPDRHARPLDYPGSGSASSTCLPTRASRLASARLIGSPPLIGRLAPSVSITQASPKSSLGAPGSRLQQRTLRVRIISMGIDVRTRVSTEIEIPSEADFETP